MLLTHLMLICFILCLHGDSVDCSMPMIFHPPVVNPNRLSVKCREDLAYVTDVDGLNHTSYSLTPYWQQNMLDAYGKWPSGNLEGNMFFKGDYHQCITTKVWKDTSRFFKNQEPDFKGKYCIHDLFRNITWSLMHINIIVSTTGICIPSSCTETDVEKLIDECFGVKSNFTNMFNCLFSADIFPLRTTVTPKLCYTDGMVATMDWITKIAAAIIGLFVLLLIIASLYDIAYRIVISLKPTRLCDNQSMLHSVLVAFSAFTNTIKLLDTKKLDENHLSCINGLRAVSMCLVVGMHTIVTFMLMPNTAHNPAIILTMFHEFWAQPLMYATTTVETFFCITGFLVTVGSLSFSKKSGSFNILKFYIFRYWRITPIYMLAALSTLGPYKLIGSGPFWEANSFLNEDHCREHFWKAPFYINSFTDVFSYLCMPHTWYINVDMFFTVLCPIILYPLAKNHWSGSLIWLILLVGGTTNSFAYAFKNRFENIFSYANNYSRFMHFYTKMYIIPWMRPQSFLMGIFFGYIYHKYGNRLRMNKYLVVMGWTLTWVILMSYIYGNYSYTSETATSKPSRLHQALFISVGSLAWATAIGWIILACATGYGGVVNSMLSWKLFAPLGRISFATYIIHIFFITYLANSTKRALYADKVLMLYMSFGVTIISICFGWIISMMIEAPLFALEDVLSKRNGKETRKKTHEAYISSSTKRV